jgi:hypothetical protein
MGVSLGLAAGVRDAGEDAAPVVVANRATDEAIVLEALYEAGEGALRKMDLLGQLLDAPVPLRGLGQAAKNLVLAQREAMLTLKTVFEGLAHAGVLRLELIPSV